MDETVARIVAFLHSLPIDVAFEADSSESFLPGIRVVDGGLRVDPAKLKYPGDLLHEAGHLALLAPSARRVCQSNVGNDGGFEMGAIAWSYAACVHLELDVRTLFHDAGYRGGAAALRENFAAGRYIGVPMLTWLGLCDGGASGAGDSGFPRMERWLVTDQPV